jgi:FAD/FMN-containing dehydrogenase
MRVFLFFCLCGLSACASDQTRRLPANIPRSDFRASSQLDFTKQFEVPIRPGSDIGEQGDGDTPFSDTDDSLAKNEERDRTPPEKRKAERGLRTLRTATTPWRNFEGTVVNYAKYTAEPKSTEDVAEIVKWAAARGLHVRPIGTGHSWSQSTQTHDVLLSTSELDKVLHIDKAAAPGAYSLVTAQAGAKLRDIGHVMKKHGLTFSNLGSMAAQTIGGVVSTNTHGTGIQKTGFAGVVDAFVLVDGRGEIHHVNRENDPDLFRSVCGGIGLLGVITEVTFRVEPAFNIEVNTYKYDLDDITRTFKNGEGVETTKLQELLDSNEWFQTMTIARTNAIIVVTGNRTTKPPQKTYLELLHQGIDRDYLIRPGTYLLAMMRGPISRGLPRIGNFFIDLFVPRKQRPKIKENSDAFTLRIEPQAWAYKRESEFFMPRRYAERVLLRLNAFFEQLNAEGKYSPAPFFGMRFVHGDDNFLSSTYIDGDNDEFLAVEIYDTKDEKFDIIARAQAALEELVPGEPRLLRLHLGKIDRDTPAVFRSRYKNWDRFEATVRRVDPQGVFQNDWTGPFFQ